ncbi:HD-GYP domain-containing protein [Undibacterium sp. Ren11W]|uniref:HD-GYP domain-containing protein n=1 Tax=Undibacterium sp. Ren11W TaxID=3413045 RepID=UPI003BF43089
MTTVPITTSITLDQLCVGLYIHLDLGWLEHSFARNNFKIKNQAQIEVLKQLGLSSVRVEAARSDCAPLVKSSASEFKPPIAELSPSAEEIAMIEAKKARVEKLNEERAAIARCEKEFVKTAAAFKNISSKLFSRPQDACQDADQLIGQMQAALVDDMSIAIHVMNDKIAGEDAYYHSLNVSVLAMILGKELALPPEDIKALGIGCLFHDIGKIEIPDRIVNKHSALSRAEQNLLQQHCQYGVAIAEKMGLSKAVREIILQHHEYADGSGYPQQLRLEQIGHLARIACIINAYDKLCNHPNPAESLTPYEALALMFKQQRKLYDPAILNMFIRCMGVYPPGTLVELSDGTPGMVVSNTAGMPLRPSVLIYDPSVPKNEAIILNLSEEPDLNIRASLKAKQLQPDVYAYLSPRQRMAYFFESSKSATRKN